MAAVIDWRTQGEVAVGFTDAGEVVVIARPGISSYSRAILATQGDRVTGRCDVPREIAREIREGGEYRSSAEGHLLDHLREDRVRRAHEEPIRWDGDR